MEMVNDYSNVNLSGMVGAKASLEYIQGKVGGDGEKNETQ